MKTSNMRLTKRGKKALVDFYKAADGMWTINTALCEAHRRIVQPKAGLRSHYKKGMYTKGVFDYFGIKGTEDLFTPLIKVGNSYRSLFMSTVDFNNKTVARLIKEQL